MNHYLMLCGVLLGFGFEKAHSLSIQRSDTKLTKHDYVNTPHMTQTNNLITSTSNKTPLNDLENCTIEVDNTTAEHFIKEVQNKKYDFAYLNMYFNPKISYVQNQTFLYPYIWKWTHSGEDGLLPVLEYPYDYGILSLGFLNKYVNYNVTLIMHINPANCSEKMALGQTATLSLLYRTYGELGKRLRTNGSNLFCYTEKADMYNTNRFYYYLSHFFGFSEGYLFSVCYREDKHGNSIVKIYENSFRWILKIWSLLTFVFCPLLIHLLSEDHHDNRRPFPVHALQNNYQEIENVCTDNPDEQSERNDGHLLYKGDSPMSIFVLLRDCICFKITGPISNRIRRVLFILLSPCLLYVIIVVYAAEEYRSTYPRILVDVPIGLNSILYGFFPSMNNMDYFFGGPYIMLSVYFVVTLISVCIPGSLPDFLTQNLQTGETGDKIDAMLGLNGHIIENLSGVPYTTGCGFKKLSNFMKARIYLLLNIKFWKHALSQSVGKCFVKLKLLCWLFDSKIVKFILLILTFPIWILFVIVSVLLIFFIILYYGFPMIFLVKHVVATYQFAIFNYMEAKCGIRGCVSKCKKLKLLFNIIVFIVFLAVSADVVFAFALWFNTGLSWLWKVIGFTFVALIVYPKDVVGYSVMAITSIFYLWKCIQNTCDVYTELFNQSIDSALIINDRQKLPRCIVQHNVIYIHDNSAQDINKVWINGGMYKLEQIPVFPDFDIRGRRRKIVAFKDGIPGIPATLFFEIVEQIRPLRKELFLSLIKFAITFQFLYSAISTIEHFERSYNIDAIAQVVATVSIGLLPLLAEIIGIVPSAQHVMELDIQNRKIKRKITEYLDKEINVESEPGVYLS